MAFRILVAGVVLVILVQMILALLVAIGLVVLLDAAYVDDSGHHVVRLMRRRFKFVDKSVFVVTMGPWALDA